MVKVKSWEISNVQHVIMDMVQLKKTNKGAGNVKMNITQRMIHHCLVRVQLVERLIVIMERAWDFKKILTNLQVCLTVILCSHV